MSLKLNDPGFLGTITQSLDPSSYANLVAWWKADSFSLSDGTAIGGTGNEWLDQSGNANDLTQGTASARPLFKTNIFGSMPAIRFDGGNDELTISSTIASSPFTIICIGKVTADSGLLGNNGNTFQVRIYRSSENKISYYDGTVDMVSTVFSTVQTSVRMNSWRRDGSNNVLFRENKTDRSAGATSTVTPQFNRVGRLDYGQFFAGDIGEIVVYGAARSNTELDNLYDLYFSPRWGLP